MTSTPVELSTKETPVACTLSDADAQTQVAEWAALRSKALSVGAINQGVRMTFPRSLADTVHDLAAREQACCSFLAIDVVVTNAHVQLDVVSPNPDGLVVVHALLGDS